MAIKLGRVEIGDGKTRQEIECCGVALICQYNTNTCSVCNTDYNMSGQKLAPREQWGEETGESPNDVLLGMDS